MTSSEIFPGGSGQESDAGRLCKGGARAPLLGVIGERAGHDPSHRLVTVANQNLFAVPYELDVSAQLRLQVTDIDGSHVPIIAYVTMLVIFYLLSEMARENENPSTTPW